jgi:hypothetical protein
MGEFSDAASMPPLYTSIPNVRVIKPVKKMVLHLEGLVWLHTCSAVIVFTVNSEL